MWKMNLINKSESGFRDISKTQKWVKSIQSERLTNQCTAAEGGLVTRLDEGKK